jgi:hypothetical protein
MARSPLDDVADVMKDAAYVTVGLGVIAFQRLQVRRNELAKALNGSMDEASNPIELVGAFVGERLKVVEERLRR